MGGRDHAIECDQHPGIFYGGLNGTECPECSPDWQARAEAAEARASRAEESSTRWSITAEAHADRLIGLRNETGLEPEDVAAALTELQGERDRAEEALREIATGEEVTKGAVTFVRPGRDYAKQVLASLDHSEDTGDHSKARSRNDGMADSGERG